MSLQDILSLVLIISLVVITGAVILISYFLIKALKTMTNLMYTLQDTTESVKQKLQMRFISLIPSIILGLVGRFLKKRG